MNLFTRMFNATCLVETTILGLLLKDLHKGNICTLRKYSSYGIFWLLWNLEKVGTKTRFARINKPVHVLETSFTSMVLESYGFLDDGRHSYAKVSVSCFCYYYMCQRCSYYL